MSRRAHLLFNDAKNMVSFVDGHASYVKIYWNTMNYPGGTRTLAVHYDPPARYDYQMEREIMSKRHPQEVSGFEPEFGPARRQGFVSTACWRGR